MPDTEPVRIVYVVDIGDADKEIARLTGGLAAMEDAAKGAAKPMDAVGDAAAATAKDMSAAATATNSAATATKKAGDAAKDSGSKLDAMAGGAKKLKGGLDLLIPGLGSSLMAVDDLSDGVEGVSGLIKEFGGISKYGVAALGGLAAGAVVVAGAYRSYTAEIDAAAEQTRIQAQTAAALIPLERQVADAKLKTAIATGALTEAEGAERALRISTQRAILDYNAGLKEQRAALTAQIASTEKYIAVQRGLAVAAAAVYAVTSGLPGTLREMISSGKTLQQVIADDARALNTTFDSLTRFEQGSNAARSQLGALDVQEQAHTATLKTVQEETIKADAANRKRNAGLAETTEWIARVNAAMESEKQANARAVSQFTASRDVLVNAETEALAAIRGRTEGEVAALDRAHAERIAGLEQVYQTELNQLGSSLAARETLTADYERAITATERNYQQERAALQTEASVKRAVALQAETDQIQVMLDEQVAAEKAANEAAYQFRLDNARATNDLVNSYVSASLEGAAMIAQAAGANEKKVFAIRKAAALASGAILAAQAVLTALQTPPPLTPFAVGAAIATGAVQLATIAASKPPSYRSGGVIGDASALPSGSLPDARLISAEIGEAVLSRQGVETAGGAAGVAAQNAGVPPAAPVLNLMLRHEVMDRVTVEQLQRPSALRAATTRPSDRGVVNPYRLR